MDVDSNVNCYYIFGYYIMIMNSSMSSISSMANTQDADDE